MNDMHEAVSLPDSAVKRLVHPTDLTEARALYLRGWWFGRLCSLPVVVAIGAVVWVLSGNLLASLAAPISTFAIALAASRWHEARAWDFIPRKRQDRVGAGSWRLLAAALDAGALLVTAGAVIVAVNNTPVSQGVVAYTVGSGLGIAVLQIVEIALAVVRQLNGTSIGRRAILLVAVIAASVLVAVFGSRTWSQESYVLAGVGMATVLLAQLLWWAFTRRSRQRTKGDES
ncbi:MAG: hypothetical protein QM713_17430 [Arachnia sp.]